MRNILQYFLKIFSQLVLWRYKPLIIAVTGSVGKTSTKEAIYAALKSHFRVRRNIKSYNNKMGMPLTILGLETGQRSIFKWTIIFFKALKTVFWAINYPEILVLEMGTDKPGDIKYLTDLARPKISVVTAIGQFPVHLEFFPAKDDLIKEKTILVEKLPKGGTAVLNYDDLSVRDMRKNVPAQAEKITYGFDHTADVQLSLFSHQLDIVKNTGSGARPSANISFKAAYKGSIVPMRIYNTLGKQQVYAAGAAIAVGLVLGLNLVEISQALKKYRSLAGRTNLIEGIKKTLVIDDSYNASPSATIVALEILQEFKGRKIAVLADMTELGQATEPGHRQVGQKAAQIVDLLFVVGARARFISDEARKQGLAKDRIFEFDQPDKAALKVQKVMKQGDIVLVKGSQVMRMEKVVKEIMAHPEKAKKLLVRQLWTN